MDATGGDNADDCVAAVVAGTIAFEVTVVGGCAFVAAVVVVIIVVIVADPGATANN